MVKTGAVKHGEFWRLVVDEAEIKAHVLASCDASPFLTRASNLLPSPCSSRHPILQHTDAGRRVLLPRTTYSAYKLQTIHRDHAFTTQPSNILGIPPCKTHHRLRFPFHILRFAHPSVIFPISCRNNYSQWTVCEAPLARLYR